MVIRRANVKPISCQANARIRSIITGVFYVDDLRGEAIVLTAMTGTAGPVIFRGRSTTVSQWSAVFVPAEASAGVKAWRCDRIPATRDGSATQRLGTGFCGVRDR
jgi:hypothetical protein